jgi:DNA-binding NtrC family response regulator
VGGNKNIKVDVRVIAATNQDLEKLLRQKKFREDLYYRLNVIPLYVPALRQRREDIPYLAECFLQKLAEENGKPKKKLSPDAMRLMMNYQWPGNVRELENAIERSVVLEKNATIMPQNLPPAVQGLSPIEAEVGTTAVKTLNEMDAHFTSFIFYLLLTHKENFFLLFALFCGLFLRNQVFL